MSCALLGQRLSIFDTFQNVGLRSACDNKLYFLLFCSQNEDEIADYYRRKYVDTTSAGDRYGEGEEMSDEITQQGLLPGVK